MERETFIEHFAAEQTCWHNLLGSVREEQALAPAVINAWSVRDVVVHVAFSIQYAATHLEAIRANQAPTEAELYGQRLPPSEVVPNDDKAFNGWMLAQARTMTFEQAVTLCQQAMQRFCDALAALDDETLLDRKRQFPGLPWKGERTLLEVLEVFVLQHAIEHREAIEAWLSSSHYPV